MSHEKRLACYGVSHSFQFVDERRKLEADLKTLHTKFVKATKENVVLRQELDDVNMRYKMFEHMEPEKQKCVCLIRFTVISSLVSYFLLSFTSVIES